jgi:hypothetical protein
MRELLTPDRTIIALGAALAVIALERLLSAALVVSPEDDSVSIRLLVAFVCGGLAPVVVVFGYLKRLSHKSRRRQK